MIEPYICPRLDNDCGRLHTGCIGHNRAGGPCGAQTLRATGKDAPPEGRPRCRNHLGRNPAELTAEFEAEQEALRAYTRAQELAAANDAAWRDHNPFAALMRIAAEAVDWMDFCRGRLAELREIRYRTTRTGEQIRAEVLLWERSMDRAARINHDVARLGIEAKLAAITSQQVGQMISAIDGVLAEFGFSPHDPAVAARVARVLAGLPTREAAFSDVRALDA